MLHVRFSQPEVRWVPDEDHVEPEGTASLFFSPQYTGRLQRASSQDLSSSRNSDIEKELKNTAPIWKRPVRALLHLSLAAIVVATAWSVVTIYKSPLKGAQSIATIAADPVEYLSSKFSLESVPKSDELVSEKIEEDVLSSKMSAVRKKEPKRSPAITRVFGTVNQSDTGFYSLPKPRGQLMKELKAGDKLQLLGRYEDWIWVKHEDFGKGWVLSKAIQAQKSESPETITSNN
jgi:hypothetical protein